MQRWISKDIYQNNLFKSRRQQNVTFSNENLFFLLKTSKWSYETTFSAYEKMSKEIYVYYKIQKGVSLKKILSTEVLKRIKEEVLESALKNFYI